MVSIFIALYLALYLAQCAIDSPGRLGNFIQCLILHSILLFINRGQLDSKHRLPFIHIYSLTVEDTPGSSLVYIVLTRSVTTHYYYGRNLLVSDSSQKRIWEFSFWYLLLKSITKIWSSNIKRYLRDLSETHVCRMRICVYKMCKPKGGLIYVYGCMVMQKNSFLKSYHTVFFTTANTGSTFGPIWWPWPYYLGCPPKYCVVGFQKWVFCITQTSINMD